MNSIQDYFRFCNKKTKSEILKLADKLEDEHIVMINSTPSGGGVAEILNSLVLLLNDLGLDVGWRILKGSDDFFQVTKEFHNGLQGEKVTINHRKKELYENTNEINARSTHIESHDLVVVHDPQPLALIEYYKKRIPWILRLHIDLSKPDQRVLEYLKPYIEQYDSVIVSSKKYKQKSIKAQQLIMPPSIDPLNTKNFPMTNRSMINILKKHGVTLHKPIISQISRFDKWKDPVGVIEVFKKVKKQFDCQLVLLGNLSIDDPEAPAILKEVRKKANHDKDITILLNVEDNDRMVNALQSVSEVVLQKSLREGFALTVSEAMWKGTPVVASRVGGIPLQVKDGVTGFLINNISQASEACLKILTNKKRRNRMGRAAKKHIKNNFLITRHILDYLRLFDFYLNQSHQFNIGKKYPY